MKTSKLTKIIIVLIVLFIVSCGHNYKVKTIVYADGSCKRILTVVGDSIPDFFAKDYPIPIDSTWNLIVETETTKNGDTVFIYKASKFFESVEQMNLLYANDTSAHKNTERTVTLNKRFRWFYTFLDYQETYPKLFEQPALINYLDSSQYNYVMLSYKAQRKYLKEHFDSIDAKQFNDEAEKGLNEWLEFTIINSCMDAIEKSAVNIEDWPVSKSEFTIKRDSINKLIDGQLDLFDADDGIFDAVKRVFKIDSVLYHKLERENHFKQFKNKYNLWEDVVLSEEYSNSVLMPGLIIKTNSKRISDSNQVEWNVGWAKYFTDDYEMKVTSRTINIWAFWVSGGFILIMLITFILKRVYKR
jgi:hypothetical protein